MVETGNRKPFLDTEVEVTIEDILKRVVVHHCMAALFYPQK